MLEKSNSVRVEQRRDATRQEVLRAAWALAREQGLAGLSLREVARAVGLRAPSLYSYFGSKHAIYDAMFAEGAQAFADGEAQLPYTGDPLGDLKLLTRFYVGFCADDVERYQLLYQRPVPGFEPSPASFEISVRCLDGIQARFEAIGLTGPGALDLMTAIGAGLAAQQVANDPSGDRWLGLVDEAMEMFFEHQQRKAAAPGMRATHRTKGDR